MCCVLQVMLFFYMIVLFIIFIIQFSVACACLAINEEQQSVVAAKVGQGRVNRASL